MLIFPSPPRFEYLPSNNFYLDGVDEIHIK